MEQPTPKRLFENEAQFVHWLAHLLETNPAFSRVAVEALIGGGRGPNRRMARADILAVRSADGSDQTLIIECKSVSVLYGRLVDETIAQLKSYGELQNESRQVLAFPGTAPPEAAAKVKAAGIELWDLKEIGTIFGAQLKGSPADIREALKQVIQEIETAEESLIPLGVPPALPGRQ